MTTGEVTATSKATFSPPSNIQRSPWHSPVPYLFGGLAAMLGLIAFALLILACSYWKLDEGRDVENGDAEKEKVSPVFEEKVLVIMAGDVKPTFVATPKTSSRASSFNEDKLQNKENQMVEENGEVEAQVSQHQS